MEKAYMKPGSVVTAMILALISGSGALADDTELFVSGGSGPIDTAAQPNILFILDTSGSMDSEVLTQEDWDPSKTFTGCYRADAVYWSYTNSQPSCYSNNWFYANRNYCEASYDTLNNLGEYSGNLLEWRQSWRFWGVDRWVALSSNHNRNVECQADAGVHGSATGAYWAADGGAGPWSGNSNNEPAWTTNYHLFNGNYLNWLQSNGTVAKTRIEIVRDVTTQLLNNLNGVNVGLMRFNFEQGGPVLHAMEDIGTAREDLKSTVASLNANGWTPLSETLYEAGQYYAGRSVDYGDGYNIRSVAESRVGGTLSSLTYDSPLEFSCQKNYIVLLSDGEPTRDVHAENKIEALPGFTTNVGPRCERLPGVGYNNGKCLDEMAEYLFKKDLSAEHSGDQNVVTYTIGFAMDLPLLESTASRGGGRYYRADDTTTLASALTKIVVSILDDATTFTAPSVPVNAFNRTQNLDDIFVTVFNPSSTVNWPGNLKKYRLKNGKFMDANDLSAVDLSTGFFKDTAQSFWSVAPDGDRTVDGGAANMIPNHAVRKLYTSIAGSLLTLGGNAVAVNNTALTGAVLGGASEADAASYTDGLNMSTRDRVISWMRGVDLFDEDDDGLRGDTRQRMGDPLHVRPVPVIYGGTAADPDMVLYTATNEGYLHAIDPETGEELWAFVPERLLSLMLTHYRDDVSPSRVYGLDGEITAAILNDDKKGGITGLERVILVFGMRRGGDAYFAVDVTDRNSPKLLWEFDSNTTGFEQLGQSWSTAQHARVRTDQGIRDVLFIGGGYDPVQDNSDYRTDNRGNAVYMVDLETGDLLWSAGDNGSHDLVLDDMQHSIPAPLRVVDVNGDGLASRLYFGDMGGRVWRIDLINGASPDEFAEGGVLASLGGAADGGSPAAADIRRFYNQADVVSVVNTPMDFMAVNIGSGYRAHPLDGSIDDYFFSVRDFNPIGVVDSEAYEDPVEIGDLVDVASQIDIDSSAKGWKMRLSSSPAEKILSRSVTYNGTIYVTSFAPGSGTNACTATAGQNRLYAISLFDGRTMLEDEEPYIDLKQGGIAPQVELLYVPEDTDGDGDVDGVLKGLVGPEDIDLNAMDPLTRTYWTQDGAQ